MGIFSFLNPSQAKSRLQSDAYDPQFNWWSQVTGRQYEPPIYSFLNDDEWEIFNQWHQSIYQENRRGESAIPFMSIIQAFIMGNNIDSVVEFGCFAGFSTLLIGFMMRKMDHRQSFASIDINPEHCRITQEWVDKSKLNNFVRIFTGSSHDTKTIQDVLKHLSQKPKLIIIDSSHQHQQTLNELNTWYEHLQPGGLVILHDTSQFAAKFDSTNQGGVNKAFIEWTKNQNNIDSININSGTLENYIYLDNTGLGIIQKQ